MNPLDKQELQPFLRNLKEEMPIHTETTAKIKRSYSQGMPKNLMEYSAFVNNHFLNDNLAIIEEMQHRNKQHPIPKWFRQYQLRHYAKYGILKGDHFFGQFAKIFPDLGEHRGIGFLPYAGQTLGFGTIGDTKVLGPELEVYLSSDVDDEVGTTQLLAHVMSTNANIGDWYSQVAIKRGSSGTGGNYRMGIYDDDGTPKPRTLLGETGSNAIPGTGTYTYQDLSNGGAAATTVKLWASIQNDTSGKKMIRNFSLSSNAHLYGDLSYSYAAPPSSWTASYHETTNNFRLKIRGN